MLGLYPNVVSPFLFVITGYLCDRFKVWKIISFIMCFVMIFEVLLVYDLYHNQCKLGFLFDFSFLITYTCYSCGWLASVTLLMKLVSEKTRGTMLGLNGMLGSIINASFAPLAGYLYDHESKEQPFLMVIYIYGFALMVTLGLGYCGKIY